MKPGRETVIVSVALVVMVCLTLAIGWSTHWGRVPPDRYDDQLRQALLAQIRAQTAYIRALTRAAHP